MKIRLFITALFLTAVCTNNYTQDYTPIIINGEVFFKTEMETSGGFVFSEITVANFEKINGLLYNRVFYKIGFDPDMFIGHLREEPGIGKLYFRAEDSEEDLLVYDISLEEGDQISLSARWCDGVSENIATVVEVIEMDGKKVVIFDREVGAVETCEPLRFIEGIGPNASVIFPYFIDAIPVNGTALRLCHASRQNIIFYPENMATDFCGLEIPTAINPLSDQKISLFPNPAIDQISFVLKEGETLEKVLILNGLGQHILTSTSSNVDISKLNMGIYYLIVEPKGNGQHYSGRFVKTL